jgi:hydroxymethylpyrimidine pyrophosphatase-like HAD family hydrolase
MRNADDEVKAAADDVCPPVDEDGVAVWIEQHLFKA